MSFETQTHLLFLSELVSALRENDSDTFRRWLSGGIQDLGRPAVEELMLEPLQTCWGAEGKMPLRKSH